MMESRGNFARSTYDREHFRYLCTVDPSTRIVKYMIKAQRHDFLKGAISFFTLHHSRLVELISTLELLYSIKHPTSAKWHQQQH